MSFEFGRIRRLPPYVFSVETNLKIDARHRGEDIIDLGMGDPDQGTPQHMVDKMVEATQNPKNHRYSASKGITKLRSAVCDWYKRRYDVSLDPETEAVVTIGSKEGLSHLALATVEPGDVVLTTTPAYPIHPYAVIIAGGRGPVHPAPAGQRFLRRHGRGLQEHLAAAQDADHQLPEQPCDAGGGRQLLPAHRGLREGQQPHRHSRPRLRGPELRRLPGAEHAAGEGRQGRGPGVLQPHEELQHGGLARGVLLRQQGRGRSADQDQELPGLRHVPAHPDRVDHRAERAPGVREGDLGQVPVPKRRARGRAEQDGVADREAQGGHVRLGRDPGALPQDGIPRVLEVPHPGSEGRGFAGRRVRRLRGRPCALRARGERAPHPAGGEGDQAGDFKVRSEFTVQSKGR